VPVDHLYGSPPPVLVEHLPAQKLPNLTVVSPDAGVVWTIAFLAKTLDAHAGDRGEAPRGRDCQRSYEPDRDGARTQAR